MRVPVSWLREHLELSEDVTTDDIVDAFVRLGVEVEGVEPVGRITGPLVIGRVVEIEELTQFKKPIRYCRVDVGPPTDLDGGEIDPTRPPTNGIICGAQNFREGDLVVVALPGAVLPGDFEISERKTYGHVSEGMICSARELGIGEDHSGILVLPPGTASPGDDAREVLALEDTVLELAPTPDLGHALSIRGLARELACAFDAPYGDPAPASAHSQAAHAGTRLAGL